MQDNSIGSANTSMSSLAAFSISDVLEIRNKDENKFKLNMTNLAAGVGA